MSAAGLWAAVVITLGGAPISDAQRATFGAGLAELRRLGFFSRGGLTGAGQAAYAVALRRWAVR